MAYRLPSGPRGDTASDRRPKRKVYKRPAPAVQPGPYRATERKAVEKQKRTSSYAQTQYKAARPEGKTRLELEAARKPNTARARGIQKEATKQGRYRARGDSPGLRAADFRKVAKQQATAGYADALVKARRTKTSRGDDLRALGRNRLGDEPRTQAELRQKVTTGRFTPERVPAGQIMKLTESGKLVAPQKAKAEQAVAAPILKVLDQTTRPVHAVAAGTNAAIKGKNVPKAALAGLKLKDKTLFSDVLKSAGVKNKAVAGAAGFILDVGLDPTTYLSLGAAPAAKQAAQQAAKQAERQALKGAAAKTAASKAVARATQKPDLIAAAKRAEAQSLKSGASPQRAAAAGRKAARRVAARDPLDPKKAGKKARQAVAQRAGRKAAEKATAGKPTNQGLTVAFGGRQVPGVTRATAAAKRAPRKVVSSTKLDQTRVGQKIDRAQQSTRDLARDAAANVNPNITPVGMEREAYQAMRRSARTVRAQTQRGDVYAGMAGQSFKKRVGDENYRKVIDAIENGTTKELPPKLRQEAARFQQATAKMLKAEKRAGIKVGDVTRKADGPVGYVPHLVVDNGAQTGAKARGVGKKKVDPSFGRARRPGSLAEKNAENPGKYSEDLAQVYANRASLSSRSIAQARFNQKIAKEAGRPVKPGNITEQLGEHDAVYKLDGSDLVKITKKNKTEWAQLERKGSKAGKFTILNEKALERVRGTSGTTERGRSGMFFDKVQGVWKMGATVMNPGYYVRNLAGEMQNAYLAESVPRLAKNAAVAKRALKEVKKREEATRNGEKYIPGKYGKLIDQAEGVGAIRSGQYARELGDLMKSGKGTTDLDASEGLIKQAGRKRTGSLRRVGRARDNMEDVFRLASFKGGLDRGLDAERALERSSKNHFDYGDLTPVERGVLRRVMPFYTFSSRNIPLQVRSLVQNPGKYAQYQKIREEMGKAFGFEEGWEKNLPESEQRAAPLPVKWKGKQFTISLGSSGLPLTDLNEMPVSTNPGKALDEWLNRASSMVTPMIKSPVELWGNFSFFFRDQLERDTGPLVPAPSWVGQVPKRYHKELGIVPDYIDKKTGKVGWGWRAKADYLVNQVPGPAALANRLSKESSRSGQSKTMKVVGYLGPRVKEVQPAEVRLQKAYEDRQKVRTAIGALGQRNPSPAVDQQKAKLRAKDSAFSSTIETLKQQASQKKTKPAPVDAETRSLLKEAQQAAPAIDDAERRKLLKEAGIG